MCSGKAGPCGRDGEVWCGGGVVAGELRRGAAMGPGGGGSVR